ncbi:MAG: hypothetical protein RLY31_2633 [Bacteroidota bacterium]|jgi:glycosyltransferase involved in cell wall biosynthesis
MVVAVNTRLLLPGKLEGIGRYMQEVLLRLTRQHPSDRFFFLFDRPFDPAFVFADNVTPVVLSPPARHPLLFVWWFEYALPKALARLQPDVFLSMDNFLSLHTPVPTVLVTHDLAPLHFPEQLTLPQRWYYQYFLERFNRRADAILAVSHFTRTDILNRFRLPPEKVSVAGNAGRPEFQPLPVATIREIRDRYADGQPFFLYVGAIHPRKNVHRLIAAFERFKQDTGSSARLVVAGRFAWRSEDVRSAWETSPFRSHIRFPGYVPDNELPSLTAAAFACVYVSLFEGFGVPLVEAMLSGVPVITSNTTSMPEVAGDAAILVNPEDIPEIASAMAMLWRNDGLRTDLVARGFRQATSFRWEETAAKVYATLEKLLPS